MTISFIIPVYNTAQYLERCVLSIISQLGTDSKRYELIIVNDGSTDNSHELIRSLHAAYPALITVIEQENKGLGAARNAGQKISRGKYIFFVDSDDYINENSLQSLFSEAEKSNSDIIEFGVIEIGKSQKEIFKKRKPDPKAISGAEYLLKFNPAGGACFYLFNAAYLSEHNIRMPEGIYHEDELFLTKALLFASNVEFADYYVYIYDHREGSITKSKDEKVKEKKIKDSLFVLKELLSLQETYELSEKQLLGLNRKIKLLSHDIVIVLIRHQLPKQTIYLTINELKKINLFPLPYIKGSRKHSVFRRLTHFRYFVWLYSKSALVRRYLENI